MATLRAIAHRPAELPAALPRSTPLPDRSAAEHEICAAQLLGRLKREAAVTRAETLPEMGIRAVTDTVAAKVAEKIDAPTTNY